MSTNTTNGTLGAGSRASQVPPNATESRALGLTPRQYEVLVLLARGHTLKAIAQRLNIAVATVKVHAETTYQRLHVHNRTEAVYAAISRGATLGWSSVPREIATGTVAVRQSEDAIRM